MSGTAPTAASARLSASGWLRAGLRLSAMLLLLSGCVPAYYLWKLAARHNPWPRRFLRGILALAGVKLRVSGNRSPGGAIFIANHVSWLDIPALAGATGTAFVAHDGLAAVPLVRWLCRMNDTVFVARHDRKSIARQVSEVRAAIRDTGALTIFPEGTTGDGAGLLPFKSSLLSAFEPLPEGIAVQPLWIDYGAQASRIAWVGNEPGLANFLRIVGRSHGLSATLHFLAPLEGPDLAGRKAIAAAAREAIAHAMERARVQRVAL